MADWHVIQPQVRVARKRHRCDDCPVPIEPGDRYQLLVTPPNRDDYGPRDRWLTWRTHYPRNGGERTHLIGCAEAAAYLENAGRTERASA